MIEWESNENDFHVGRIGPAVFNIDKGVGDNYGVSISAFGDCWAILNTAKTIGEAKRFCEWTARAYGFDRKAA